MLQHAGDFSGQSIYFANAVNFIAEEFNADGIFRFSGREHLYGVPPDAELRPHEVDVIALIMNFYQLL